MGVLETETWTRAVAVGFTEYPDRNELSMSLAQEARARDVVDLLRLCRRGTVDEIDTAMRVLLNIAAARDRRLRGARSQEWLRTARAVARRHYPRDALGAICSRILFDFDRAGAERLVLRAAAAKLSKEGRETVVRDLARLNTPRASGRLGVLAKGRSAVAKVARHELALRQGPTPQELGALASRWRRRREYEALQRLDSLWLPTMVGKPIRRIGQILGSPEVADDDCWVYRPQHPASAKVFTLALYLDDEGRLEHHNLSR